MPKIRRSKVNPMFFDVIPPKEDEGLKQTRYIKKSKAAEKKASKWC